MPPHGTGQEGISKLCGALNRSRGQYRVGERWVVEPERSREAVGETRFALHPGSTQRVTPPKPLAVSMTNPPVFPTCSMWKV